MSKKVAAPEANILLPRFLEEFSLVPDDPLAIVEALDLKWEDLEALVRSEWCELSDLEAILSLARAVQARELRADVSLPLGADASGREPAEIEAALATHPAIAAAAVAARDSGPGDTGLIAYLVRRPRTGTEHELTTDADLAAALRLWLPEWMRPSSFVFLGSLPRTAHGKVDRAALPAPDARAERTGEAEAPASAVEASLTRIWERVLGISGIGVHDNFFDLGGDSILAIQVIARACDEGLRFQPWQLFQHQTVADLAAVADAAPAVEAEQGAVSGEVPLTPIQRWFFDREPSDPAHWNFSLLLAAPAGLEPAPLAAALAAVIAHHDALRLRFERTDGGWRQHGLAADRPASTTIDLGALPADRRTAALTAAAGRAQASFDLARGPLLRAVRCLCGAGEPPRLLLALHHLVVDGVSWRVLLEDLGAAYRAAAAGERLRLPPKTTSFRRWAERLADHAAAGGAADELDHWRTLAGPAPPLPADRPAGSDRVGAAATVATALGAADTERLLREVPAAYRTRIDDVLLAALALALGGWTGRRDVRIELEGHGRELLFEDLDVSRTVGWFTARYPVRLEPPAGAGPGEALLAVKKQLRAVPGRGLGFGVLRWLDPAAAAELRAARAEVAFNYLGQLDQAVGDDALLVPAAEDPGPQRSPRGERDYPLQVTASVLGGELRVNWTYGRERYRESTVRALAGAYLERLRELIEHCVSPEAGGAIPSDFPLAALDRGELDRLSTALADADDGPGNGPGEDQ